MKKTGILHDIYTYDIRIEVWLASSLLRVKHFDLKEPFAHIYTNALSRCTFANYQFLDLKSREEGV